MLKLLKNKNFSLLFAGNLVSQVGTTFYNFAIGWFILTLTESPLQAGLYLAFGAVLQVLLVPFAGVFVDRFNKVRILVVTDLLRGLSVLAAGFVLFILQNDAAILGLLYAVTFILALNGAFFGPSATALKPEIVKDEELNQANSFFSFINSIQLIVGIIAAGIFYVTLGIEWIFIINGLSFLLSAISEMFIKTPLKDKTKEIALSVASYFKDFKDGFSYLKDKTGLLQFMFMALLLNVSIGPFFSNVLPFLFNLELNRPPLHLSIVQVAFSLGMLAGGIVVGSLGNRIVIRSALRQGLSVNALMFLIFCLLVALVSNGRMGYTLFYFSLTFAMFAFAVANMWVNIPFNTGILRAVSPEIRGRVLALMGTISSGFVPLSMLISGALLEFLPVAAVVGILFSVCLVPYLLIMYNAKVNELLLSLR